ncbi:uncharacterized protein MELLADRAFT_91283 [Melampsora larici-populina 98AG31]|uniref:Uncharacterized protein n=1 Tax=Melampsora larici-populina (strain 98AG31 / pathotype 3-4-7) TaxID=747676 RepID=F4RYH2_MELLP|nr:uncharacterized protein MELLADRAFT_91283 [Melampsora larici-populina 98AG31]EGG02470.1 hypothetical protein MELLADRAFT_91283 [Melampsora larici-populina 98AG31]
MSACFGYVPLTIFVPAWLLADKNHMSNRRKQSSSCLDVVAYVGLRVPSEWRQSFLMWSTSFHLCIQYWRLKYEREDIATRLEEHYKIVLEIKAKYHDAFAPALRYDIIHRTNVFSHTLADGLLSDVGMRNEELVEQAITDSKANKDHWYFDNPYIIGGAMENVNPMTGRYQVGWDMISNAYEQITAVTGGQMLSHLAQQGRNYTQPPNGQFFLENNTGHSHGNHGQSDYVKASGSGFYNQNQGVRGKGRRGRGVSRGVGGRGGSARGSFNSGPTSTVNGVVVPKFGPGAFEAMKAAKQAGGSGSGNGAGTQ